MTDDNWKSAKLAIGLGKYNKELVYGVWAKLLVGDLIVGKELIISNEDENGKSTVIIDKDGITLDGGAITWTNSISSDNVINSNAVKGLNDFKTAVKGSLGVTEITSDSVISPKIGGGYLYISNDSYSIEIDPKNKSDKTLDEYIFAIRNVNSTTPIMGVDASGNGYFKGKVIATEGEFTGDIIGGSISIGDNFSVDHNGNMEVKNAYFYGTLGTGWEVDRYSISAKLNGSIDTYVNIPHKSQFSITNDGIYNTELSLQDDYLVQTKFHHVSFNGFAWVAEGKSKRYTIEPKQGYGGDGFIFGTYDKEKDTSYKVEIYNGKISTDSNIYCHGKIFDNEMLVVGYSEIWDKDGNFRCYKYRDGRLVIEYSKKLTSELSINNIDVACYAIADTTKTFPVAFRDIPMVLPGIGVPNGSAPFCHLTFDGVSLNGFERAVVWTSCSADTKLPIGTRISCLFIGRWINENEKYDGYA